MHSTQQQHQESKKFAKKKAYPLSFPIHPFEHTPLLNKEYPSRKRCVERKVNTHRNRDIRISGVEIVFPISPESDGADQDSSIAEYEADIGFCIVLSES